MGLNQLLAPINHQIYLLKKNVRAQLLTQRRAIESDISDIIEPLNDELDEMKDTYEEMPELISDILEDELRPINETIGQLPDEFDDVKNSIADQLEPVLNSVDDVKDRLLMLKAQIDNIPENVGRFTKKTFETMQDLIQMILDRLNNLDPRMMWQEVKGTALIILPFLIILFVLIQSAPTLLLKLFL